MFDAAKLLDQLMGAGTAARMDQMSGGKFSDISHRAAELAAQQTQAVAGKGGYLDQAKQALPGSDTIPDPSAVIAQTGEYVAKNSDALVKGAVAGTILAALIGTKAGRAIGGTALRLGGLAAIGGLAFNALRSWQAGQGTAPTAPQAALSGDADKRARSILEAMISAAKVDGEIDAAERARILAQAQTLGVEAAAQAFIEAELAKPLDIAAIGAGIDGVDQVSEIYAASALAINATNAANIAYLDTLAERFKLDPALRAHLDEEVAKLKRG
ncbi:tellurite resistance TerB family protein [Candidatus Raskinella chloraquaticus]|uniref:Protein YebE n=1 Tax=Candidatus Raskinella chloraquaticus TaxID=1951219 RepID=A0A1W9HSD2_9HYPH|nr:MAG: hypothetical protein A4S15_00795 [Proteobacteria bacterium SG_bin8]